MTMLTKAANDMREINQFVNEKGIRKDQIVNIIQSNDGVYMLIYFSEE